MNVKRLEVDSYNGESLAAVDESVSKYEPLCPAEDEPFKPCGKRMRRRKNGITVCPIHGEMH